MLASWLAGDVMKMFWFFNATSAIPWAFKLCGIFQMCCDGLLGVQYLMYGAGESPAKGHFQRPTQLASFKPPSRMELEGDEKSGRLD